MVLLFDVCGRDRWAVTVKSGGKKSSMTRNIFLPMRKESKWMFCKVCHRMHCFQGKKNKKITTAVLACIIAALVKQEVEHVSKFSSAPPSKRALVCRESGVISTPPLQRTCVEDLEDMARGGGMKKYWASRENL